MRRKVRNKYNLCNIVLRISFLFLFEEGRQTSWRRHSLTSIEKRFLDSSEIFLWQVGIPRAYKARDMQFFWGPELHQRFVNECQILPLPFLILAQPFLYQIFHFFRELPFFDLIPARKSINYLYFGTVSSEI